MDWKLLEKNTDHELFYVNIGVNGLHHTKTLVDNNNTSYATMSNSSFCKLFANG